MSAKLELNSQEIEELAQWIETLPVPNYDRDNADAVAKVLRAEALQASLAVAREVLERAVAELKECAMDYHRDPRPLIAELDALLGEKP